MIVATGIETGLWNKIVQLLVDDHWKVTYQYDNVDAGIDFDFVILEKENEEILLGWDNWFEGEIMCLEERMKQIEAWVQATFNRGEPENLKPNVIALCRKWKTENVFNNPGLLRKR